MPDIRTFYEVALLDALPPNAHVAALQHTSLQSMATAADAVVPENMAADEVSRSVPVSAINSMSLLDRAVDCDTAASLLAPQPSPVTVAAVGARPNSRRSANTSLCSNHARWGKETYKCASPRTCKKHNIIVPRPSSSSRPASGNGKAGGQ